MRHFARTPDRTIGRLIDVVEQVSAQRALGVDAQLVGLRQVNLGPVKAHGATTLVKAADLQRGYFADPQAVVDQDAH